MHLRRCSKIPDLSGQKLSEKFTSSHINKVKNMLRSSLSKRRVFRALFAARKIALLFRGKNDYTRVCRISFALKKGPLANMKTFLSISVLKTSNKNVSAADARHCTGLREIPGAPDTRWSVKLDVTHAYLKTQVKYRPARVAVHDVRCRTGSGATNRLRVQPE